MIYEQINQCLGNVAATAFREASVFTLLYSTFTSPTHSRGIGALFDFKIGSRIENRTIPIFLRECLAQMPSDVLHRLLSHIEMHHSFVAAIGRLHTGLH